MINKTNKAPISQNALKEAYKIVQADLLTNLTKLKAGEAIRLNGIGTFTKKKHITKVKLKATPQGVPIKNYGKTISYYQINFRSSQTLKQAIDK